MGTTHIDSLGFSSAAVAGGNAPTNPSDRASNPVIIFGSGVPTVVAPKGSLYLRTDGLPQIATDSIGGWAAIGAAVPQNLAATDSPTFVGLTLSGVLAGLTNLTGQTGFHDMTEMAAPAAPAANVGRLYMVDVAGKTAFVVRFPTGAVQQIAIEP